MKRTIGVVVAMLLPTAANAQSLHHQGIENLAGAIVVQSRRATWTIDPKHASDISNFFKIRIEDMSPGGRDWPQMERVITEITAQLNSMDDSAACVMAESAYGPKGLVSPNMMIRKQ